MVEAVIAFVIVGVLGIVVIIITIIEATKNATVTKIISGILMLSSP